MSLVRCAYLDCGARTQFSRSLAAAIAFVMMIAAFGWSPDAHGKRKSRNKDREPAAQAAKSDDAMVTEDLPAKRGRAKRRSGHRLDQTVLRYLPDDCRAFGWIKVAPMLESEMGRKLLRANPDFWKDCSDQLAPLELKAEQIERIVLGARVVTEGEASKAVTILFCKQPVQKSEKVVVADGTSWISETIGPWTIWVRGGEKPWAVCTVEDRVVLAGYPEPVREVLRRDGPSKLPEKLDRGRRLLSPSAAVAVTFLPTPDIVQTNSLSLPIAYDLVGQIDAFNFEVEFDADLAMRLSAVCRDEAAAQQLNGIAKGLLALVQMQALEDQQPEVRHMIRSLAFDVEGPVITASMNVPSELVQLTECDAKGSGGSSWQLGLTTPNAATTPPPGPVAAVYPGAPPSFQPGLPATPTPTVPQPYCPPSVPGVSPPYPATPSCPPSVTLNPRPYAAPPSYAPGSPAVPSYGAPSTVPPPSICQPSTPASPTLQIADVVRLVKAGVDDEIIIRHIQKHTLATDLRADDLILLTESGASTPVITALQEISVAPKPGQPGTSAPAFNPYATKRQAQILFPSQLQGHSDTPIFTSESLRQLQENWERIWFGNPDNLPPQRVKGGVI